MLESRSVLVVEADPKLAQLCVRELEYAGARVRVVRRLADALAALADEMPDAILADAALPAAECAALWASVSFFYPVSAPPVVVMSDADAAADRRRERSPLLRLNARALVPAVAHAISRRDGATVAAGCGAVARPVAAPVGPTLVW